MNRVELVSLAGIKFLYSYCNVGKALPLVENQKFKLCSLENIAGLRILQGWVSEDLTNSIFDNGPILTREAVLCIPGNPPSAWLVKESPLLKPYVKYIPEQGIVVEQVKIAKIKEKTRETDDEFYDFVINELKQTNFSPTEKQICDSLENAIEFPVNDGEYFSTFKEFNDLKNERLFSFIFRENFVNYKNSLARFNVEGIRIYPENANAINKVGFPFVRQVFYGRDETADICINSSVIFAHQMYYIYGLNK